LGATTNFDTTRIRFGEMIAAVSGLVLFISLFLEWYNVSAKNAFVSVSRGASGWEALGFIDILLFVIAAVVVAIAITKAMNVLPRLPASTGFITLVLGAIALLLVLYRIISIPDDGASSIPGIDVSRSFGVFVAFIAAAGVTVGGWLAWNEEGKPRPGGAGAGSGAAPGGGSLGSGQPYGAGQPQAGGAPQQQSYAQPAAGAAPAAAAAPAASSAQPDAPEGAKADWYPDPRGEKRLRYWDGSQWTDHTAD
jgi:hypothetical protein